MLRKSDHPQGCGGSTSEVTPRALLEPEEAAALLWGGGQSKVSKVPWETVRDRIETVRRKREKGYSSLEREVTALKEADVNQTKYMSSDAVDFGAYLLKPGFKGWEGESSFEAIVFSSYLLQSAPGFTAQKPAQVVSPSRKPKRGEVDSDELVELPSQDRDSPERRTTLTVREKLRTAFFSEYGDFNVSDCRSNTCVGPVIYWSKEPCLLFPVNWENNHWVGIAVDNARYLRKLPSETSGSKRAKIVIMDSWGGPLRKPVGKAASSGASRPEGEGREVSVPQWHEVLASCCRRALYAMFGADDALCAACKGAFERDKTSPRSFDGIVAVSPRVPYQYDTTQCGAMTLLALQSFVRRPVFRRHCRAGTRSPSSPTLAFYSHADAIALRRYIREERDRFLSNQSKNVLPEPFNDRPDAAELRSHVQGERYKFVTGDFSPKDHNRDDSSEEIRRQLPDYD